jgi:ribosomal protein L12E/L44/L45/RPP1/RPP2
MLPGASYAPATAITAPNSDPGASPHAKKKKKKKKKEKEKEKRKRKEKREKEVTTASPVYAQFESLFLLSLLRC